MPDAFTVAADLRRSAQTAHRALERDIGRLAQLGLAKVRAFASGRPGPRRVTGDYQRSMSVEQPGPFARSIGTNAVQARRLEYGFVGADSLGRVFDQPAYPHWGPMAEWLEPLAAETLGRAIDSSGLTR